MPLKAFVKIRCSRCEALRDITMHDDGIHVESDSHSCPKWKPEMGPPDPPRSFYMNQAVIFPDDKEEWERIQANKSYGKSLKDSIGYIFEDVPEEMNVKGYLPLKPKTQPCPICDTQLETPGKLFMALKRLREKLISYGDLAIENEKQLKKDDLIPEFAMERAHTDDKGNTIYMVKDPERKIRPGGIIYIGNTKLQVSNMQGMQRPHPEVWVSGKFLEEL